MIALKIEEIKDFTSKLFIGQVFDKFLVREVEIVTYNSFQMDGRIRRDYYTGEELEEMQLEEYSLWSRLKPICFMLIKGNKLPESFQVVLQMPKKQTEHFMAGKNLGFSADQVKGLYLNIRYEKGELFCVTGTSVSFFTMDKTLDHEWDSAVKAFFKKSEILAVEG